MERHFFVSFNLTLFFFFFLLPSSFSFLTYMPLSLTFTVSCLSLSTALKLSLSLEISCILKLKHYHTHTHTHTHTWWSVLLLVKKQNPIPFAALVVVGIHKSSLTTTPYIFGGAQMGVVWISADRFSRLQTESK